MKYLNYILFLFFFIQRRVKNRIVSSTFVMLSSISDDVKVEGCRTSFAWTRGVGKYKGKDVFKVSKGGIR